MGSREGLEVVVIDRLIDARESGDAELMQQLGVPSKASDALGDGAGSAAGDPSDLPVGRAVDDALRDGNRQLGTFEVVARGERLLREAPTAGVAAESGNDAAVAFALIRRLEPVALQLAGLDTMLGADRPRAEPWGEPLGCDALDRSVRPIHSQAYRKWYARRGGWHSGRFSVRRVSASGQTGRTFCEPLCASRTGGVGSDHDSQALDLLVQGGGFESEQVGGLLLDAPGPS